MDILGMPWHFWLVLGGTAVLIYGINRVGNPKETVEEEVEEPVVKEVKLFGGPLNGKVEQVNEQLDYFIVPYMPNDPEEAQKIGVIGDKVLYTPNFAFYQQVGEPEFYFHRRDLTVEEFQAYNSSGELPEDLR